MDTTLIIPTALREVPRWVVWRTEDRNGTTTKVPYRPDDPSTWASSTSKATWSTYQDACATRDAHPDRLDGIGFVLGDGWAGVDLDDCRDPETGELAPWAKAIVATLDSYTEVSPSGTGLKVFLRGEKPGTDCRTDVEEGEVEVYDSARYFTVTGEHLEGTPTQVRDRGEALREVYLDLFGEPEPVEEVQADGPSAPPAASRLTDDELLSQALEDDKFRTLFEEGDLSDHAEDHSRADQALACKLAFYTGCDPDRMDRLFRQSALMRDKWDRDDYRARTIRKALELTDEVYDPGERLEDFWAFMPSHNYIHRPTRAHWPGASVNARVGQVPVGEDDTIPATRWLDKWRAVHAETWAPGEDEVVKGYLYSDGGREAAPGIRTYNLYKAPRLEPGDPEKAQPWLDLIRTIYPDEADHLIPWFAHRVQRPGEKINYALVLGGRQGIGKDTILEPLQYAVGFRNMRTISPDRLTAQWTEFVESVVLVVNEARDLGDINRYKLYEKTKSLTASPPPTLEVNRKHAKIYYVPNVVGVVFTTNHRDGLYLPDDDRRHLVAWSEESKESMEDQCKSVWAGFNQGDLRRHVTAYLLDCDLSDFDPKPKHAPRTAAWEMMVSTHRLWQDEELAGVLDRLDWPPAVTKGLIETVADPEFGRWVNDRANFSAFRHALEDLGYIRHANRSDTRGRWYVDGHQQSVYVNQNLTPRDRNRAAQELARRGTEDLYGEHIDF